VHRCLDRLIVRLIPAKVQIEALLLVLNLPLLFFLVPEVLKTLVVVGFVVF
jgi:hypothetical protein